MVAASTPWGLDGPGRQDCSCFVRYPRVLGSFSSVSIIGVDLQTGEPQCSVAQYCNTWLELAQRHKQLLRLPWIKQLKEHFPQKGTSQKRECKAQCYSPLMLGNQHVDQHLGTLRLQIGRVVIYTLGNAKPQTQQSSRCPGDR